MIKILLLLLIFSFQEYYAQWDIVAPYPIPDDLLSSYFFNDNSGLISGLGVIYKSEDAFSSFTKVDLGLKGQALNYDFIDNHTGFIIVSELQYPYTNAKYVYKTTDGGNSFFELIDSLFIFPKAITFINLQEGWMATNNGVIYSSDGGYTWEKISQINFSGIKFLNRERGFATRNGILYFTNDSGLTWSVMSFEQVFIKGIKFKDSLNGILIGEQTEAGTKYIRVLKTSDGGNSWIKINTNLISGYKFEIFYQDSTIIIFTYEGGARSDNGGSTWAYFELDYHNEAYRYAFAENYYYHFGYGGTLYRSLDRGNNWENIGSRHGGYKIQFVSPQYGLTAPWYFTSDGGISWNYKEISFPHNQYWEEFWYFSPDTGLYSFNNKILKTYNGGLSWDTLFFLSEEEYILDFFFFNADTGWVLTRRNLGAQYWVNGVRNTTDGAATWSEFLQTGHTAGEIIFITNSRGFLYGSFDLEYGGHRTMDGGITWEPNQFAKAHSLSFVDSLTAFAVRDGTQLVKTTDGGDTYSIIASQGGAIFFIDTLNGWRSNLTRIEITTDGGKSWSSEFEDKFNINSFYLKDHNELFAIGQSGRIVKRRGIQTGNETNVEHTRQEFYITENYPNPFNPSTRFSYFIPELSFVVIKVFDILGNEIETLVSEEKPAGEYQVEWNASAYSSGVYFYRFSSGEFTSTKKLLLMK